MGLGGLVLGSLILYLKGMRIMMFHLSGFYCIPGRCSRALEMSTCRFRCLEVVWAWGVPFEWHKIELGTTFYHWFHRNISAFGDAGLRGSCWGRLDSGVQAYGFRA